LPAVAIAERRWKTAPLHERVGQAVVDFGFSGVIEKFEEHWGKRATKALLLLIGLAVVAISLGAIWTYILGPLVMLVAELIPDHPSPHARNIAKFLTFVSVALLTVNIGLSYFDRYLESQLNWRLLNKLRESKALLAEARRMFDEYTTSAKEHLAKAEAKYASAAYTVTELRAHLETAQTMVDGLREAVPAMLAHAVEQKMLTPDQAAELDKYTDEWRPSGTKASARDIQTPQDSSGNASR